MKKFILIILITLFSFSVLSQDKMYLKLNEEVLMGHDYSSHDDYTEEIDFTILVDDDGRYIYKYVDDSLVPLNQTEIDEHPLAAGKGSI